MVSVQGFHINIPLIFGGNLLDDAHFSHSTDHPVKRVGKKVPTAMRDEKEHIITREKLTIYNCFNSNSTPD